MLAQLDAIAAALRHPNVFSFLHIPVQRPAVLECGVTHATALQPLAGAPLHFAMLVGLSGFCQSLSMPSVSPLILDNTTSTERSRALALRQMTQDAGALVGAGSAGFIASAYGVPAAVETVAVLQGASVAFFAMRAPWKTSASK